MILGPPRLSRAPVQCTGWTPLLSRLPGYTDRNCSEGKLVKNLLNNFIFDDTFCLDINECELYPCEYGNCTDLVNNYSCSCIPGYTGRNCSKSKLIKKILLNNFNFDCTFCLDINECESNPCDYGNCTDLVNNYSCSCIPGYTDRNCSEGKLVKKSAK